MQAFERRKRILEQLETSQTPVSATALAELCGVSRQIIVGDVALLRAGGANVSATPRGYILTRQPQGVRRTVACVHSAEDMSGELYAIVDNGGEAVDVIVEHPVYGQITAPLHVRARCDVEAFLEKITSERARPLSSLTDGVHLHTIACPTQADMNRVVEALRSGGFLFENG
ncbi:MAG: transcription repressor NadR [Oscillospiraceae bacterium]|nr:transcription repressor NadR [Oscillospiraceae bacterium]